MRLKLYKMRKLFLFLTVFCAISCTIKPKLEKPFIIIKETSYYHGSYFDYEFQYQDKNGNYGGFRSEKDKYEVGDIIK